MYTTIKTVNAPKYGCLHGNVEKVKDYRDRSEKGDIFPGTVDRGLNSPQSTNTTKTQPQQHPQPPTITNTHKTLLSWDAGPAT